MFWGMITLFITAFAVIFSACSQFPGTAVLADSSFPLTYGFATMFNLEYKHALWLSFPALYANFYGFVWAAGRQMSSMAKSGLLPEIIGRMNEVTDTPVIALVIGGVLSFSLALIAYYEVIPLSTFKEDVKHMYMLSSYIIYAFMFVSYIMFKSKYSTLPRNFTSPFGIYGAVVGCFIFCCNAMAILIHTETDQLPLIVLFVVTAVMVIYYFLVLDGNQQFSEEEKNNLFKAYLINGKKLQYLLL